MARAGGRDGMSRRTEVPWLPDRMLRAAIVAARLVEPEWREATP